MFSLVVFCVGLVASTSAQFYTVPWGHVGQHLVVGGYSAPSVVISRPVIETSHKYHAQDALGQFAFGHVGDNQAREEVKTVDGAVRGGYSYVDPKGKLINVQYLADSNGFRILGANNLPVAPEHTLEPVKDTPEVVEARAAFLKEFEKAKEATKSRRRRDIIPGFTWPVKTREFIPIDDAKTPAATKLAEIKEKEIQARLSPILLNPGLFVNSPLWGVHGWTL